MSNSAVVSGMVSPSDVMNSTPMSSAKSRIFSREFPRSCHGSCRSSMAVHLYPRVDRSAVFSGWSGTEIQHA